MQTKRRSFSESVLNTASGFVIAMLTWRFIITPMFDIVHDPKQNLAITTIFTVISIARSYMWRRIFNKADGGKTCTTVVRDKDLKLVVLEIQPMANRDLTSSVLLRRLD